MKIDSLETEEVEYVKPFGKFKDAAVSLCAMLNSHGHGVVYFGVKKDGLVVGRDLSNEDALFAAAEVERRIAPNVEIFASVADTGEGSYLKMEAAGENRPYSASDRYYIRYGAENRIMSPEQLRSLSLSCSSNLLVATASKRQNLDFSHLKAVCKSSLSKDERSDDVAPLQTADGRYNRLGYMLADDNDLFVRVCRRDDSGEEDFECGGKCMLSAMGEAEEYVKKFVESASSSSEKPVLDLEAFEAAWRNAFLHNAWHTGAAPRIDIYDDKMEIASVGGLVEGMSEEDFFSGLKRPVNFELENVMQKLGFIEGGSHKISTVLRAYRKEAFKITDTGLVVTIPFRRDAEGKKRVASAKKRVPLSDRIVALIEEDPYITADRMSARCDVSKSTISNTLGRMTKDGRIAREGSKKTGMWKIL